MSLHNIDRTNRSNTGKSFEAELAIHFRVLESRRILRLRKVDPPTRILGGGRKVITLANPFLDYVGVWTAGGGRAIFLEAKSTAEHRLPINRSGGVTEAQFEALQAWDSAGGVAAVLWRYGARTTLWSAEEILSAANLGAKSLQFEHGTPVDLSGDFLQSVFCVK